MKTKWIVLTLVLMMMAATAYAESAPQPVIDGLEAYKTSGSEAAFIAWLKNSPLENDKAATSTVKGAITQIESFYGKMTGYEVLYTVRLTASSVRTYAEIQYEKGSLFAFFDSYKSAKGWIIPNLKCHTEAQNILPRSFFDKK